MDLILTDEQRMLQDSAGRMLAQLGGVKRARSMRGKEPGYDQSVLARTADEGWLGVLVPPELGGLGLGMTELALVLLEGGKVLAPEPIAPAALAAAAIAQGQRSASSEALLGGVLAGSSLVVPAIEGDGSAGDRTIGKVEAGRRSGGLVLNGVRDGVAAATAADGFLVAAAGTDGPVLVHVARKAAGVTVEARATVDSRSFARLRLENAEGQAITGANDAGGAICRLYDLMLVTAAAELVGAMSAALDITVEYLKTRKQFGRPIGSFQALQHRAVDDYTRIMSTRSLLFQVAAQGTGLSSAMASALKAHAGGEALKVTKSSIQMHGAIGFTDEHDIGLYLKRAMWLSAWLGNEGHHRKRYAALGT